MSALRSFARRLLLQALVSGIVMTGIQVVVRLVPAGPPFGMDRAADAPRPDTAVAPVREPARPAAFVQDRTSADVRAGRFAVWRERAGSEAARPAGRPAAGTATRGLSDVVLFDRCRPDCESQDPLLAFNQHRSPTDAVVQVEPEPIRADALPPPAAADGTQAGADAGIVAAATRSGVSWARRVAGAAGSALSW